MMPPKKRFTQGLLLGHIELTEKQKKYLEIMLDPNTRVVFLTGCSGTGKTFLSLYAAFSLFNKNSGIKINYVRTVVESAEKSMGYLKGSEEDKFHNYTAPLIQKCEELLNAQEIETLKNKGVLQTSPINFVRGLDWSNTVVCADECQNFSFKELTTLLTRINKNTKVFLAGDFFQNDVRNTGFKKMASLFKDEESQQNGIHVLDFTKEDIMRDGVVRFLLERIENSID